MAAVLTNIYLEPAQRKYLEQCAKRNKSNLSAEARRAIDLYRDGISLDELTLLDDATRRAAEEIAEMNAILDRGLARAKDFFQQIDALRNAEDRP